MLEFSIRPFTLNDVDFAVRVTGKEHWGYTKEDFTLVFLAELGEQFIAEEDITKQKMGMLSTFKYGGKLAWIGNVIVQEDFRGKGIGTALLKHAIRHLKKEGVKTIRLYSYQESASLYQKLSFTREGVTGLFTKRGSTQFSNDDDEINEVKARLSTADKVDLERLIDFDGKCFGADRRRLLTSTIHSENAKCFVKVNDKSKKNIVGYIIATEGKREFSVGPWVCDPGRVDVAEALIRAVMDQAEGKKITAATPLENAESVGILEKLKFTRTIEVLRLRKERDLYNGKPEWIFAAGGVEKG